MTGSIRILVNGESRTVDEGLTIAGLLNELSIRPDRVAVELNLEIVDRKEFEKRGLGDGDRLEVISFIGGGTGDGAAQAPPVLLERARSECARSTGAVEAT